MGYYLNLNSQILRNKITWRILKCWNIGVLKLQFVHILIYLDSNTLIKDEVDLFPMAKNNAFQVLAKSDTTFRNMFIIFDKYVDKYVYQERLIRVITSNRFLYI